MDSKDPRIELLQKWSEEGLLAQAGFTNSSDYSKENGSLGRKAVVPVSNVVKSLHEAGIDPSQIEAIKGKIHQQHQHNKTKKNKLTGNEQVLKSLLMKEMGMSGKKKHHNPYNKSTQTWHQLEALLREENDKLNKEVKEGTEMLKSAAKNRDSSKLPTGMNDVINRMIQAWASNSNPNVTLQKLNVIIEGYVANNPGVHVKNPYTIKVQEKRQYTHAGVISAILSFVTRYIGTNWKGDQKKNSLYEELKTELKKIGKTKHNIFLLSQAITNKKKRDPTTGPAHATHVTRATDKDGVYRPSMVRENAEQAFDHNGFKMSSPFE